MQDDLQEVLQIKKALQQREARQDGFLERGECGEQERNGEQQAQKLPRRTQRRHKGRQIENEPDGINQQGHGWIVPAADKSENPTRKTSNRLNFAGSKTNKVTHREEHKSSRKWAQWAHGCKPVLKMWQVKESLQEGNVLGGWDQQGDPPCQLEFHSGIGWNGVMDESGKEGFE